MAEFSNTEAAMDTYRALVDAEISGALDIEGVLVVKADGHGNIEIQKVTEHSTKTGVKWGVVGGVVLGVLFPPSIIGSAAALGISGGVLGKLRHEHHKSQLGAQLQGALAPDTSGIIVLATMPVGARCQEDHARGHQGHRGPGRQRDRDRHHRRRQDGLRLTRPLRGTTRPGPSGPGRSFCAR